VTSDRARSFLGACTVLLIAAVACGGGPPSEQSQPSAPPAPALDAGNGVAAAPVDPFAAAGLDALALGRRLQWPVESVHLTSSFGWRVDPVTGAGVRLHRGVDFRGRIGDLVMSIGDGTIAFAGHDPLLGNLVIVEHGDGLTSLYGHLSDVLVHEGVPVEAGAAIGLVGNTGRSEASHLHLTVKLGDTAIDPMLLLGQPPHRPDALAVEKP
jgi:murein DD-endopeptidase MepM/ murein hydrolase activator NlpD